MTGNYRNKIYASIEYCTWYMPNLSQAYVATARDFIRETPFDERKLEIILYQCYGEVSQTEHVTARLFVRRIALASFFVTLLYLSIPFLPSSSVLHELVEYHFQNSTFSDGRFINHFRKFHHQPLTSLSTKNRAAPTTSTRWGTDSLFLASFSSHSY